MTDEHFLNNIDSLLFQCARQTRELSQKKNEMTQQMKVCRADIAEARSNIEKYNTNIKRLEEEIKVKQSTLIQNKAIAKSMKRTNSMLLHYEKTTKDELENRKASYNHDREAFELTIASCRATYQSHKEYYYNNPLAQKLLALQTENKEIEARIKACDDQITLKKEELYNLTAPVINVSSPEKLSESVSEQLSEKEPEEQPEQETHEEDNSSLHHCQTEVHPASSEEVDEKIQEAQNTFISSSHTEQDSADGWGFQQMDDQNHQEETQAEEKDHATLPQAQALEEQLTVLEIEQAMEEEMEEAAAVEGQFTNKEADESFPPFFSQPFLQETSHESSPARQNSATPTFPFMLSPGTSLQISDSTKSPAFSFTLNSGANTPGFFGIDVGSAQDEDAALPFSSPLFGAMETVTSETSLGFLFDQLEPSEDFQLFFNAKSPDQSNNDKAKDDFPFSFNF